MTTDMNKLDTKDLALAIMYQELLNIDISKITKELLTHTEEQKIKNIIKNHRKQLVSSLNDSEIINFETAEDMINYIKKEKYERF